MMDMTSQNNLNNTTSDRDRLLFQHQQLLTLNELLQNDFNFMLAKESKYLEEIKMLTDQKNRAVLGLQNLKFLYKSRLHAFHQKFEYLQNELYHQTEENKKLQADLIQKCTEIDRETATLNAELLNEIAQLRNENSEWMQKYDQIKCTNASSGCLQAEIEQLRIECVEWKQKHNELQQAYLLLQKPKCSINKETNTEYVEQSDGVISNLKSLLRQEANEKIQLSIEASELRSKLSAVWKEASKDKTTTMKCKTMALPKIKQQLHSEYQSVQRMKIKY